MRYKKMLEVAKGNRLWFLSLLLLHVMFVILLWLVDSKAIVYLFPIMFMASVIFYLVVVLVIVHQTWRKEEVLQAFLENTSLENEEKLKPLCSREEQEMIARMGELLRAQQQEVQAQQHARIEYEEYLESWAHEIKTPLGLMTLVLDNRREEIEPTTYYKLEYARTKMSEDIERMLYYGRVKDANKDYFFQRLSLLEVCQEVIEEYTILLQEQGIHILINMGEVEVVSDQKGLAFIVRQVISNAMKYKKQGSDDSYLEFTTVMTINGICLDIKDNGIGVAAYDLPFVFEKGFTGEVGEQQKNSTGMGLYLAAQVAQHLNLTLEATSKSEEGFQIRIVFPVIG